MITQVCNLSCTGCTNFSDLKHSGYVSWQQGRAWLDTWLARIDILDFGIMGGEPMINPEWKEWVTGVRTLLPTAQIRFTTNGLLLHKHPELLDFFEHIGNVVFKISVHVSNSDLEEQIVQIHNSKSWQLTNEFGIARWKTNNNLRFQLNRPTWFYKTFKGNYENMQPHGSNPNEAFAVCVQQTCPLLHRGLIYKCSTSALTPEIVDRFDIPDRQSWKTYQDKGITYDCTDAELTQFVNNFGKPHAICGQCPSQQHSFSKLHHPSTVTIK